jgi:hypothetical protein
VNFDVQFEGSPTAVSEVIGLGMIGGAGVCSMQWSILQRRVTRSGHTFCVSILSYIYIYIYIYSYITEL